MENTANARIEMRVDIETKRIAERAAASLGCASLTEYIPVLSAKTPPRIIQQQTEIRLTNRQFNDFMNACQDASLKPSQEILEAARLLDSEGL